MTHPISTGKFTIIKQGPLLRATTQSIATGVGGQFLLLISGPLVARILGVEGRGYFAALHIWPAMLAVLGTFGIPVACSYFLSSEEEQESRILGTVYRIAIRQAVVLTAILGAFFLWWGHGKPAEVQIAIFPTLLIIPASLSQEYSLAVLQGKQRFVAFNAMRLLPALLYAICVAALFLLHNNRLFVVVLLWVSTFLLAGIATTVVALRKTSINWHVDLDFYRKIRQFGLRGYLGSVAPVDGLRLDQLAASLFLAPTALGVYVVAYAFTNLPRFISQSAGMVAYPVIAQTKDHSEKERLIWLYFWAVTFINCIITAILIIAMPFLVILFFGHEFIASVPIAQILLVGTTFAASRRIFVEAVRGHGYPQVSSLAEVSMYPWLFTGGAFLLWFYGIKGLAIAVTSAYALSLVVAITIWKKKNILPSVASIVDRNTAINLSEAVNVSTMHRDI